MHVRTILCALGVSLIAPAAFAQTAGLSPTDFATQASIGNQFEVAEAQLAIQNATDKKLKSFAQMMAKDHGKAEKKLESAAKSSGQTLPAQLDAPHQAMIDALKGKTGADFDKAYISDQLQAHSQAAELLTNYGTTGSDSKLKAWAKATLPTVKMHLKHVQAMGAV